MSDAGWGIIFVLGITLMLSMIITIVIWQVFKTRQTSTTAQITASGVDSYRKLAEQATLAQEQTAERLEAMAEDMSDLRARVGEMEKMMREVE